MISCLYSDLKFKKHLSAPLFLFGNFLTHYVNYCNVYGTDKRLQMYYCGGKKRGEHFWVHLNYVLVHLNEKVRRTSATNVKS